MGKKEKMGYQLLCLILLIAVFVLIWQNKKKGESKEEKTEAAAVSAQELTYDLSSGAVMQEFILPAPDQSGGMPVMQAFKERKTIRSFSGSPLSDRQISNLLWAANGINRPDENRRTVPTASNNQEIDIYLFTSKAIYLYDAVPHKLLLKKEGDFRTKAGENDFFADAPVALVYVADFNKMSKYDEQHRQFYSATDVGFVSQNVYLFCASEKLATVVCGRVDRDSLQTLLGITNGKVLLSQPVGSLGK